MSGRADRRTDGSADRGTRRGRCLGGKTPWRERETRRGTSHAATPGRRRRGQMFLEVGPHRGMEPTRCLRSSVAVGSCGKRREADRFQREAHAGRQRRRRRLVVVVVLLLLAVLAAGACYCFGRRSGCKSTRMRAHARCVCGGALADIGRATAPGPIAKRATCMACRRNRLADD
jgi:hypothetical protein